MAVSLHLPVRMPVSAKQPSDASLLVAELLGAPVRWESKAEASIDSAPRHMLRTQRKLLVAESSAW